MNYFYHDKKLDLKEILATKIKDIDFSERLKNCLVDLGVTNTEEIVQLNKKQLLSSRNFGRKSLEELMYFLKEYNLELDSALSSDNISHEITEDNYSKNNVLMEDKAEPKLNTKNDYRDKYEILVIPLKSIDFTERTKKCFEALGIKDIGDLIQLTNKEFLQQRNTGRKSLKEIIEFLNKYELSLGADLIWPPHNYQELLSDFNRKKIEEISTDEEILIELIYSSINDKDKFVLEQRFAHNKTLEEIASKFQVTRERIRQIEMKCLNKIKSLYSENLGKFLDKNKYKIFKKYSISDQVVIAESISRAIKKRQYPLSKEENLTMISIDILYNNIYHFFDENFNNINNGWYFGSRKIEVENATEEILYQLDKKPIPRQADSLRFLSNVSKDIFESASLLAMGTKKYCIINNYFCTASVGRATHKHITMIHKLLCENFKDKFISYKKLVEIIDKTPRKILPKYLNNLIRLKEFFKTKKKSLNHLFILGGNKLMPIGLPNNQNNYFNFSIEENIFSEEETVEDPVSKYSIAIAVLVEIFNEKKILTITDLSQIYVTKISKNIAAEQSVRLLSIFLSNSTIFKIIAPGLWTLTSLDIFPKDLADYHLNNNYEYGIEMYSLFKKSEDEFNLFDNWTREFEMLICLKGESIFNQKIYHSLIHVSKPEEWNTDKKTIDKFVDLKEKYNFYLSIKLNDSFEILHKKKDITKYDITKIYMLILFASDMPTVSVLTLNNFFSNALHHHGAHTNLILLSIAGILNAPDNNLHLYRCNSNLIEIIKPMIIDELIEFGNISWKRKFGKKIIELTNQNIEKFIEKDNWITKEFHERD